MGRPRPPSAPASSEISVTAIATWPSNHGATSVAQLTSTSSAASFSSTYSASCSPSGRARSIPSIGGKCPRSSRSAASCSRTGPRSARRRTARSPERRRRRLRASERLDIRKDPATTPTPTARTPTAPMAARRHRPSAVDEVVLITDTIPSLLSAQWPSFRGEYADARHSASRRLGQYLPPPATSPLIRCAM